jgi:hypothetical protein
MWGSHVPAFGWDKALSMYLSQTKLTSLLGTSYPALGLRNTDFTLDQDTLLTDLGVTLTGNRATEYPRMDIITTENVKFWYDLITSLKCIFVDSAFGGAGSDGNPNFLSSYSEGIYDGAAFTSAVRYDGAGSPGFSEPFAQLPTDWAQLWAGPVSKALIVNSNPSWYVSYDYQASSRAQVRAINTYSRFDSTDFDASGLTSSPKEVLCYGGYGANAKADGILWAASNGIVIDDVIQFPDATRTVLAGNMIERNIPISAPSLPTHTPDIDFNLKTAHFTFENWDYSGGFEFYTPTPP